MIWEWRQSKHNQMLESLSNGFILHLLFHSESVEIATFLYFVSKKISNAIFLFWYQSRQWKKELMPAFPRLYCFTHLCYGVSIRFDSSRRYGAALKKEHFKEWLLFFVGYVRHQRCNIWLLNIIGVCQNCMWMGDMCVMCTFAFINFQTK